MPRNRAEIIELAGSWAGRNVWTLGLFGLLAIVFAITRLLQPNYGAAAIQGLPAVLATARSDRRQVRLACFHALPAPRLDRYDRVVADADREMARIVEASTGALTTAVRQLSVDPVEIVVRFGSPGREVLRETDASRRIWSPSSAPRHRAVRVSSGGCVVRWRVGRRACSRRDPAAGRASPATRRSLCPDLRVAA